MYCYAGSPLPRPRWLVIWELVHSDFTGPQPKGFVLRYWPTVADWQLGKSLQLRSSLPSWFWLAASSDRWDGIEKLPVLAQMAVRAKRHKVLERIITPLAPIDLVVDLEVPERPALLTSPPVALQHPLHQAPASRGTSLPKAFPSVLSATRPAPLPSSMALYLLCDPRWERAARKRCAEILSRLAQGRGVALLSVFSP